jgi:site-specific recombinase XerD
MLTDLTLTDNVSNKIATLSRIAEQAQEFVAHSKAKNTVRAYADDWRDFIRWCESQGLVSLPATPDTVALYLSDRAATLKTSTLIRRMAAISQAHQIAGFETPTKAAPVRLVMAGIRRTKGTAANGKTPVLVDDLKRIVVGLPNTLLGIRDRALLLIGFAGGFRRSELTALDRDAVDITRDGIVVTLRRTKTDQDGQGRKIGIPYGSNPETCPVRSLIGWLEASDITDGPLFRPINRHGRMASTRLASKAVAAIVKRRVKEIGLDATKFAGHSLRSGLATSAAMNGASERAIMNQTGHRSVTMVRRYVRDGSLFRENAAAVLGL